MAIQPTNKSSLQLIKKDEIKDVKSEHGDGQTQQIVGAELLPLLPLISIRPLTIESHRPCMDCGSPAFHVVQTASFRKILCAKHAQYIAQGVMDEAKRIAEVGLKK